MQSKDKAVVILASRGRGSAFGRKRLGAGGMRLSVLALTLAILVMCPFSAFAEDVEGVEGSEVERELRT